MAAALTQSQQQQHHHQLLYDATRVSPLSTQHTQMMPPYSPHSPLILSSSSSSVSTPTTTATSTHHLPSIELMKSFHQHQQHQLQQYQRQFPCFVPPPVSSHNPSSPSASSSSSSSSSSSAAVQLEDNVSQLLRAAASHGMQVTVGDIQSLAAMNNHRQSPIHQFSPRAPHNAAPSPVSRMPPPSSPHRLASSTALLSPNQHSQHSQHNQHQQASMSPRHPQPPVFGEYGARSWSDIASSALASGVQQQQQHQQQHQQQQQQQGGGMVPSTMYQQLADAASQQQSMMMAQHQQQQQQQQQAHATTSSSTENQEATEAAGTGEDEEDSGAEATPSVPSEYRRRIYEGFRTLEAMVFPPRHASSDASGNSGGDSDDGEAPRPPQQRSRADILEATRIRLQAAQAEVAALEKQVQEKKHELALRRALKRCAAPMTRASSSSSTCSFTSQSPGPPSRRTFRVWFNTMDAAAFILSLVAMQVDGKPSCSLALAEANPSFVKAFGVTAARDMKMLQQQMQDSRSSSPQPLGLDDLVDPYSVGSLNSALYSLILHPDEQYILLPLQPKTAATQGGLYAVWAVECDATVAGKCLFVYGIEMSSFALGC